MHGIQFFIPGFGFVNLLSTTQRDYFIPGWGYVNDSNAYSSNNTNPPFIGYPT